MDVVYDVEKSDLININAEFNKIKLELEKDRSLPTAPDETKKAICFKGNEEEYEQLERSISIGNLSHVDDVTVLGFDERCKIRRRAVIEIPKKALRLQTFREILKMRKEHKKGSYFGKSEYSFQRVKPTKNKEGSLLKPFEDVLISVRFYRPFRFEHGTRNRRPLFAEEFVVLGSNTLAQLRDKITCICNNRQLLDISEDIYQEPTIPKTNPGFFFITDTFYNDTRNPENHDYSEVIRKWLKDKKEFQGINFHTATMEDTRFMDLSVHLGFPQVYQHHGNCEHLFTFSSIQLLSPQDELCWEDYPTLTSVSFPNHLILCHICATRAHNFIVMKSTRQFHDPAYLCRACLETYFYVNGQKVEDFTVYQVNPDEILGSNSTTEGDGEV